MHRAPFARWRIIGRALRQARLELGLDLDVVAGYLGCDPSRVSRIEDGQRGIRPDELRDLMTQYGIDQQAQDVLVMLASQGIGGGWWATPCGVPATPPLRSAGTPGPSAHAL